LLFNQKALLSSHEPIVADRILNIPLLCRKHSLLETKKLVLPDGMKIVHDKEFSAVDFSEYTDEVYFRLFL